MKPGLPAGTVISLALLLVLVLVVAPLSAREPTARESARGSPTREIDLPFDCLVLTEGLRVYESTRYLGDAFPYLLAGKVDGERITGHELTPENLGHFLVKAPQEGGHAPAAIRTGKQARAAALLFIPGRLITRKTDADRIIAAAKRLREEFKHLKPEITEFRPESYACTVRALPQDRSMHPTEAWEVAFTALEFDRYLALVHVRARVTAAGEVSYARREIVNGPMTSWQTAVTGEYTEADRRADREMRAEAARARRVYSMAAGPVRTFEDLWAAARVCIDLKELESTIGQTAPLPETAEDRKSLNLPDGTRLVLKVDGDRI